MDFTDVIVVIYSVLLLGIMAVFVWAISTDERTTKACEHLRRLRQAIRK